MVIGGKVMRTLYYLLIVFCLFSEQAIAGQKVLFTGGPSGQSQTMSFEYLDENLFRLEVASQPNAYTLFRDSKMYIVSKTNGQLLVMDMAGMGNRKNWMGPSHVSQPVKVLDMTQTGEKERVAGINGEVYQIVWRDEKGTLHDDTLVLSSDPRAKEWTAMWQKAVNQMQSILSNQPPSSDFETRLKREGKGLLRLGSTLVVTSLETSTITACLSYRPNL